MQRDAAAKQADAVDYDYLRDEVAQRLLDRLNDIMRTFPRALDLGAGAGHIAKHLDGHGGIQHITMLDPSSTCVPSAACPRERACRTAPALVAHLATRTAAYAENMLYRDVKEWQSRTDGAWMGVRCRLLSAPPRCHVTAALRCLSEAPAAVFVCSES